MIQAAAPLTEALTAPTGQELLTALTELARTHAFNEGATALKAKARFSNFPPPLLNRALEVVFARERARHLGPWVSEALLTRISLEQATHPRIAAHHATRFTGRRRVLEVCTGAGFDTAALARVVPAVTTIEADGELAAMARHNLALQGISNVAVVVGRGEEILTGLDPARFDGVWADPSRRSADGARVRDPEACTPPLSFLLNLPGAPLLGVKLSPGVDLHPTLECAREYVGFGWECREQLLWRGAGLRDGTVSLPDRELSWSPAPEAVEAPLADSAATTSGWLIDPHPALVRSGRLGALYHEFGISLLDRRIAYGFSPALPRPSPLFRAWPILASLPWSLRELNRHLEQLRWSSRTEIHQRGFPEPPEALHRKLRFTPASAEWGAIFLTRIGLDHHVFLCAQRESSPLL